LISLTIKASDDDDISCHIPTAVPAGNSNNIEFCTHIIKHAQLSSRIGKHFSTVQAYHQKPDQIMEIAGELDRQLREWKDAVPEEMRPGGIIDCTEIPQSLHVAHLVFLHYSYFGSLIAIHSTFTYPWSSILGRERNEALRKQVKVSTGVVAEASRNIILATKYINDIHASTPCW